MTIICLSVGLAMESNKTILSQMFSCLLFLENQLKVGGGKKLKGENRHFPPFIIEQMNGNIANIWELQDKTTWWVLSKTFQDME